MQVSPDYFLRHLEIARPRPSRILRYGLAFIVSSLVVYLNLQTNIWIGTTPPFLLLFLAVIISGWYGGLGPGIFSFIITSIAGFYFLVPTSNLTPLLVGTNYAVFCVEAVLFSILSELSKQSNRALRQKSALYETLLVSQSDLGQGVVLIEEGKVVYSNDAVYKLTEYKPEELPTLDAMIRIISTDQQEIILNRLEDRLQGKPVSDSHEVGIYTKTGLRKEIQFSVKMLNIGGRNHLILLIQDVTDRKQFEETLRKSEEHYRLLVENVRDYAIFTLKKNGEIASWNEGAERIIGFDEAEIIGKHFSLIFSEEERKRKLPELQLKMAQTEGKVVEQSWSHRKDGTYFFASGVTTPLWNDKGQLRGFIKVIQDVTEQKNNEEKIKHQALHDALTNLPNRTLFIDRVSQAIALCERQEEMLAIIFLDLDKFKNINDSLGHPVGDLLLQEVAKRLSISVRKEDTVARLGGDEFTILIPQIKGADDYLKVAKKIFHALRPSFVLDGHQMRITTSMGIAVYPQDGENVESLLKNADIALYQAKGEGRNTYQQYNSTMSMKAGEVFTLENDLRNALDRGEFVLYYQPIHTVTSGKIEGVEALVRWNHPKVGLVSPGDFIPLAEETGIIISLNEWILKTACRQAVDWQSKKLPQLRMSVNISARQFGQKNLVEKVNRILKETGLDPHCLELEVTESFAMQNIEVTTKRLHDLQNMGVRIAIDDFGTGHSSLNYLKHLPINTLKIDRSFVKNAIEQKQDAEIIKAIINIGHGLDLKVVSEGIETIEQLEFVRSLGCDSVQGFLFSEPLPTQKIEELLRHQASDPL